MLRRLHSEQPEAFAFTEANRAWADAQISKYPENRQASAVIPLLWRAQEQEGWLSRPAMEHVAGLLDLAYIRVLEVATFYFMFQLHPVGSIANIQICGTTSCMICGAEDLVAVCKDKIAKVPHTLSADGKLSWEEVECLGACANAPMAQIGKDYYEDLTADRLGEIIDDLAAGKVPTPGPQNGRFAAEPANGLTSLTKYESDRQQHNASVALAVELGDTVKRIDGTEVPLVTPWRDAEDTISHAEEREAMEEARSDAPPVEDVEEEEIARPEEGSVAPGDPVPDEPVSVSTEPQSGGDDAADAPSSDKPEGLSAARDGGPDDLKKISGVGPKLEELLNSLGVFHFDQVANWSEAEIAWVDENLEGFKGRVTRDEWVRQARDLAEGHD